MASVKIFSLVVRTFAKPIAGAIKQQAVEHESFKNVCIGIAQRTHRYEARMRLGLLNVSEAEMKAIKPLNDVKAVQNGANFLAESFLFAVAASLVLGETYRSSRKEGKRRDDVRERIETLEEEKNEMRKMLEGLGEDWRGAIADLQEHNARTEKVLSTVVNNGLKAGWLALGHGLMDDIGSPVLPLLDPPRDPSVSKPPIPPEQSASTQNASNEEDSPFIDTAAKSEMGREDL